MSTFALSTLGCKVNQYEAQALRERFLTLGWGERTFREGADVCVINTCVVTGEAGEKCRREIRRARRTNPAARVIVTGCAAGVEADRWRCLPGVDAVFTREQMVDLPAVLGNATPVERDVFEMAISRFAGHARAFLKIEDGCDAGCAYCIVPHARGPVRSRPMPDIVQEAARLAVAGHREIVLAGVHLGHYGRGLSPRPALADVVRAVLATPGLSRVRLSSIEALELTDDILDIAAERYGPGPADGSAAAAASLCPHFHIPLQSGDDGVLRAMNRRYTAAQFLTVLDRARRRLDRPAFTTDVIAGFPGETEEAFENTLRACRSAGFSRIHVFPFSPRPGTPAAAMPDQVPAPVVHERAARLDALAGELALDYSRSFAGQTVHPLIELRRDRATVLLTGRTERYLRVILEGPDAWMGSTMAATVREVRPGCLLCAPTA